MIVRKTYDNLLMMFIYLKILLFFVVSYRIVTVNRNNLYLNSESG